MSLEGILSHFGIVSASLWWLCSIINVFAVSYSNNVDNVIVRHPKMVFLVEFLVSAIVPAAMVAINMGLEGRYTMFSISVVITCGPPTVSLYYYTLAMPLQIIVFAGCTLTLLIIIRLRKVEVSSLAQLHRYRTHTHTHNTT